MALTAPGQKSALAQEENKHPPVLPNDSLGGTRAGIAKDEAHYSLFCF